MRRFPVLVALAVALSSVPAAAQVSLTGGTYTQSFDGIGTAPTATLPSGWRADRLAAFRTSGTYSTAATATERRDGNSMPSGAPNGIYNFGAGAEQSATDRAVGFLSTGGGTGSGNLYVRLTNETGATLTGLALNYDVEKYRNGSNANGFRIALFTSSDGTAYTSAGAAFTASFAADANSDGFASAPGVTQSVSGTVSALSIPNGGTVYLEWNYSVASGSDGSNAQALAIDNVSITPITSGTLTNATSQQANGSGGWRMLSVPVTGRTVQDLADISLVQGITGEFPAANDNLYLAYTGEGNTGASPRGFTAATAKTNPLDPGRGFIWYLYANAFDPDPSDALGTSQSAGLPLTLTVPGTATTATFSVPWGDIAGDGFYLLGNPFGTALDLSGITKTVGTGTLSATFQVWEPDGAGTYVNRTAVAGDTPSANNVTDDIAVWQGVWGFVDYTSVTPSTPTFQYDAALRVAGSPGFVGKTGAEETLARVALELTGQTAEGTDVLDRAAEWLFVAEGAPAWDRYDAPKLTPLRGTYATVAPVGLGPDGTPLAKALEALPPTLTAPLDLPVELTATNAGTYTLAWQTVTVPAEWALTLTDTRTGTTTDLRTATGYTFTSDPVEGERRFTLRITPTTTGADAAPALADRVGPASPNPARGGTRVAVTVATAQHVAADLYDPLGRRVARVFDGALAAGATRTLTVATDGLAPGVYVLHVHGDRFDARRPFVHVR